MLFTFYKISTNKIMTCCSFIHCQEENRKKAKAMILSVSRRTDIPNYYSEWFFNRIKEKNLQDRLDLPAERVAGEGCPAAGAGAVVFNLRQLCF